MAAPGCEQNNPTLKNLSVKCIETRRCYRTSNSSASPSNSPRISPPYSVWVAIYPGTFVYRWNVDERKLEAKVDTLQYSPDHDCEYSVVIFNWTISTFLRLRILFVELRTQTNLAWSCILSLVLKIITVVVKSRHSVNGN